MWGWFKRPKQNRDEVLDTKMQESQRVLLEAAIATANAAQDVTSRLKARLDDSVRQFENTARILNDALFLCDMVGGIQACNPAAMRMFGPGPLVGTSILNYFVQDDQPLAYASSLWPLLKNEDGCLPDAPNPLRGRKTDGSLIWVDPEVARLDWSNGSSSMLLLVRDISEMVRLHEVDQRYHTIIETSFDGILIIQNDKIVAANSSIKRLFGYSMGDLLDKPVTFLFGDNELTGESIDAEHFAIQGTHANGTTRNLLFTTTPIAWNQSEAKLMTIKDVTDMKRLVEVSGYFTKNQ